ncbi:MAG: class I SAM-dependent methyltransferase [Thermosynechococcaceae cyanobacterium MS004]|nr:class I SAM-dependent methyltransferase [Thermosynechococcaceae cyanobacterium MS004]
MSISCHLCGSIYTRQIICQSEWEIFQCNACTNAFTLPPPKNIDYCDVDFHASTLSEANSLSYNSLHDLPGLWQDSVRMQVQLLLRSLKRGSTILEVGCGEGILLYELAQHGFNVKGIEPSKNACKRGRAKGLDIIESFFPNSTIDIHFDAIVMSHVVEHFPNPIESIKSAIDLVLPDGHLLFVQTNYTGILPKLLREKWYWMPDQHYYHFTPFGLKYLLDKFITEASIDVVETEYSSLIHNGKARIVSELISIAPKFSDQFHLLLHAKASNYLLY